MSRRSRVLTSGHLEVGYVEKDGKSGYWYAHGQHEYASASLGWHPSKAAAVQQVIDWAAVTK